jgi:uncharacterized protein
MTTRREIIFLSDKLTLKGVVQFPDGHGPYPLVILGHGLSGLKEWTLPDVADALCQVGVGGMWFDYRNFGDSEGWPRDEVAHYGRLQDWQAAISYATTLAEIDSSRIGVWGTSLGGRDVLSVASIDRRVKAVVTQAPAVRWTPALAARMAGFGDDLEKFYEELNEDQSNRALGKEPRYLDFVKPSGDDLKMAFIASLTSEERRNYSGRVTLQTYRPTALIDIVPAVELISPTPVLFILAEQDFLPGQKEAYEATKEPKALVTVAGNHFSPYLESKEASIKAAKEWFQKHLV